MKKYIKLFMTIIFLVSLLFGCSTSKEEKTIDRFINKLISVETYTNISSVEDADKFIEDTKAAFKEYLSDNAFNDLLANRIPYFYYEVFKQNNIEKIEDIKINKIKETDNDSYTHYEYEVSYKLKSNDKSIDMTDNLVFKILKEDSSIISEFYLLDNSSSVFTEFRKISQ